MFKVAVQLHCNKWIFIKNKRECWKVPRPMHFPIGQIFSACPVNKIKKSSLKQSSRHDFPFKIIWRNVQKENILKKYDNAQSLQTKCRWINAMCSLKHFLVPRDFSQVQSGDWVGG